MSKVALSFSGGKDSCLALYELQQQGIEVACLVTTLWKESQETVAHGETKEQVKLQARKLNLPVYFIETDSKSYTNDFINELLRLKKQYEINGIAFGEIHIDGHRAWGEEVAKEAGITPLYPIWNRPENTFIMLQQLVDLGFRAKVIKVDEEKLPKSWIGRMIDASFIKDIKKKDVCPMGESGEYHTTVYDGPIFND